MSAIQSIKDRKRAELYERTQARIASLASEADAIRRRRASPDEDAVAALFRHASLDPTSASPKAADIAAFYRRASPPKTTRAAASYTTVVNVTNIKTKVQRSVALSTDGSTLYASTAAAYGVPVSSFTLLYAGEVLPFDQELPEDIAEQLKNGPTTLIMIETLHRRASPPVALHRRASPPVALHRRASPPVAPVALHRRASPPVAPVALQRRDYAPSTATALRRDYAPSTATALHRDYAPSTATALRRDYAPSAAVDNPYRRTIYRDSRLPDADAIYLHAHALLTSTKLLQENAASRRGAKHADETSDEPCKRQTLAKYTNGKRVSPPYPANASGCRGTIRLGNDGTCWQSKPYERLGVVTYKWVRAKGVTNCPELE